MGEKKRRKKEKKSHCSRESCEFASSLSYSPLPCTAEISSRFDPLKITVHTRFPRLRCFLSVNTKFMVILAHVFQNTFFQTLATTLFPLSQYTVGGRRCCPVGGLLYLCHSVTAHSPC